MTCNSRNGLIPVRLRYSDGRGNPIAWLDSRRRLLAVPVHWHPNWFYECEAWTFDLDTWRHHRPSFDLVHVHLVVNDVSIIYTIAAETFERAGHSSYDCTDKARRHPQKIHCPEVNFTYDQELRARFPPPPKATQMRMAV